jgi:hypothetical protein
MISCPVCGWEPEEGVESPRDSVIAHMSSSKGEHEGIGYQKADAMIDADEAVNGTPSQETPDTDSDFESDEEPSESTDGGLGLSGGPPVETDNSDPTPADGTEDEEETDPTPADETESESGSSAGLAVLAGLALAAVAAVRVLRRQAEPANQDESEELDLV